MGKSGHAAPPSIRDAPAHELPQGRDLDQCQRVGAASLKFVDRDQVTGGSLLLSLMRPKRAASTGQRR